MILCLLFVINLFTQSGRDAAQCMGGGEDKGAPDGGGGKEGENDVEELEESLEEDLCQLWDASMNSVSMCRPGSHSNTGS